MRSTVLFLDRYWFMVVLFVVMATGMATRSLWIFAPVGTVMFVIAIWLHVWADRIRNRRPRVHPEQIMDFVKAMGMPPQAAMGIAAAMNSGKPQKIIMRGDKVFVRETNMSTEANPNFHACNFVTEVNKPLLEEGRLANEMEIRAAYIASLRGKATEAMDICLPDMIENYRVIGETMLQMDNGQAEIMRMVASFAAEASSRLDIEVECLT